MPIKSYHGLYATIMSAIPIDVRNEVDVYCEKNGYLKSVVVLKIFGEYDSKKMIAQWFAAVWAKYRMSGGVGAGIDAGDISRTHYDKVIKIMPMEIKRDVFIHAAELGMKKMQLVESVFGAYDFGKIIIAWFRAVWAKAINR